MRGRTSAGPRAAVHRDPIFEVHLNPAYTNWPSKSRKPKFSVLLNPSNPVHLNPVHPDFRWRGACTRCSWTTNSSPWRAASAPTGSDFGPSTRCDSLHPSPYTLHLAHRTLYPTPCTLHSALCTLHPAPCTLHLSIYTLHPTPYPTPTTPDTLHPTPDTLDPEP